MRSVTRTLLCLLVILAMQPLRAEDLVDARDCVVDSVFESEWRKISDFNSTDPLQNRKWPVQQFEAAQSEMRAIETEIASISAHMELDRLARLEARNMEQALTQGLKANLLRAFWRLAWITYNTIGGPTGKTEMIKAGKSYAELFTEKISVASTAKMLGVIKKLVPKQYSKLPGNEGKVVNVGVDALLEGLKNSDKSRLELVAGVVTKVMDTGGKELLETNAMKADITPEEIEILRTQYIDQQGLQKAIGESYRVNGERNARIEALEAQLREAVVKAAEWEKAEKLRVYSVLNEKCKKAPSLQFGLSAPARVTAGEVAEVRLLLPPGRNQEEFYYAWVYDGELYIKNLLEATFQSTQIGPHTFSVQFIDKSDNRNLGMLSATIQVEAAAPEGTAAAISAGSVRVKVAKLSIRPTVLKRGDRVEFELPYSVSGLPPGKTAPVTVHFTGQGGGRIYEQTLPGEVANGNFTSSYGLVTNGWKPGRYTMEASVVVLRAVDFADGSFVVRQPDVAAVKPPAPATATATRPDDFVGDWEGVATVINAGGIDGLRVGDRIPTKFRITYQAGAYRVYDLLDPDTPNVPMKSRIEGKSVVFYYQGPAVDTQGYEHPEMPVDVAWTLTLSGNNVSGNSFYSVENNTVTLNVQATRAH